MYLEKLLNAYFDQQHRSFGKSLRNQVLVINPLFCLFFVWLYSGHDPFWPAFAASYLIAFIISMVIMATLIVAKALDSYLRKLQGKEPRTPPGLWWFMISTCAMPAGLYLAARWAPVLGPLLHIGPISIDPDSFKISMTTGGLIGAVFFGYGVFRETKKSLKQSESKLQELENQHLQSQIAALTAQMNPHLLFNALNTVASLVSTDPQKAEETIVTLSDLYRGVLNSSKNMTHSLQTELELCNAYLKVEKARFGERIQSEVHIDAQIAPETVQVPSLCLQPLVENAVKHGLSKKAAGGKILIKAFVQNNILNLSVEDDGVGLSAAKNSSQDPRAGTGTGLANCRERIHLHYGAQGDFTVSSPDSGGTLVQLGIPLAGAL